MGEAASAANLWEIKARAERTGAHGLRLCPAQPRQNESALPGTGRHLVAGLKYFCKYFGSGGGWFFWIGIR